MTKAKHNFKVGQKVCRVSTSGKVEFATVTKITQSSIYVDTSKHAQSLYDWHGSFDDAINDAYSTILIRGWSRWPIRECVENVIAVYRTYKRLTRRR